MSLIGFQLSAQVRANDRRKDDCSDHKPKMIAQGGVWGRFLCEKCGWTITCDRFIADEEGLVWNMENNQENEDAYYIGANDTPETRDEARKKDYRGRDVGPSKAAQERYPLSDYPCSRCSNPNEGHPHLVDNGSEFYWHHQHESPGSSHRSGCTRFGGQFCGDAPRPGSATSLWYQRGWLSQLEPRTEEQYLKAKHEAERRGGDDYRLRLPE